VDRLSSICCLQYLFAKHFRINMHIRGVANKTRFHLTCTKVTLSCRLRMLIGALGSVSLSSLLEVTSAIFPVTAVPVIGAKNATNISE
jgi:hypothetical protein